MNKNNALLCLLIGLTASSFATGANLVVPFLPQVLPGDWHDTLNCGPASVVMVAGKYLGYSPTSGDILNADAWLSQNVPRYTQNNGNGSPTSTGDLALLAAGHLGLTNSFSYTGWTEAELKAELSAGYPVIVAVYTSMSPTLGTRHFMVLIGMDSNYVHVNDPGRSKGAGLTYSISLFRTAWAAQQNAVVVIHPSNTAPPSSGGTMTFDFTGTVVIRSVLGAVSDPGIAQVGDTVTGSFSYAYPPPSPGVPNGPFVFYNGMLAAMSFTVDGVRFASGLPTQQNYTAVQANTGGSSLQFTYQPVNGPLTFDTMNLSISLQGPAGVLPNTTFPSLLNPSVWTTLRFGNVNFNNNSILHPPGGLFSFGFNITSLTQR